MADIEDLLPDVGQRPWNLNPAILAVNSDVESISAVIETGRLSPGGLEDELTEIAAQLNPEALSDNFIAQKIETPGSATEQSLNTAITAQTTPAIDAVTVVATASRFGIDNTGATNTRTALQQAINATPDGGELLIPAGRYLLQGANSLLNLIGGVRRGISIRGQGPVTIVNDLSGGKAVFEFSVPFEDVTNVSAISVVSITNENPDAPRPTSGVQLTVDSAPNWPRGTLVTLIANDAIAEDRPASGGLAPREGQPFEVYSSSGNTIILQGKLLGSFTTGIRVAKYGEAKISIEGIRVDLPDGKLGTEAGGGFAVIRGAKAPVLRNIESLRVNGVGISMEGCYGYVVDGYRVGIAYDNPTAGIYGYAINDKSSSFGTVDNLLCGSVRHAFTTNTQRISENSTNIHEFGRSYSTVVTGKVTTATNAAFDTHHGAWGIIFKNCIAYNANYGVQIRGVNNVVAGGYFQYCDWGVRVYEESTGGSTRNTLIRDTYILDCALTGEEVHSPGTTNREGTFTEYINVTAKRNARGFRFTNASAAFRGLSWSGAAEFSADGQAIYSQNSVIRMTGGNSLDFSGVTSGGNLSAFEFHATQSSVTELEGKLTYRHSSQVVAFMKTGTNTLVRMRHVYLTSVPTTMFTGTLSTGSFFDYDNLQNAVSSSSLNLTGSSIADSAALAPLGRTTERSLIIDMDPAGGTYTLGTLPTPLRRGATLTITNRTSGTVTVNTGGNVLLNGSVNKTLTGGQMLKLVASVSPVWRQENPVT